MGAALGALALLGAGIFVIQRRRSSRENGSIASSTSDEVTQGMELGTHATVVSNPVSGGDDQGANPAYVDDVVRERSSTDQSLEARREPESLIGQRVDVEGRGTGTVTGVKKAKGRSTQHLIAFGDDTAPEPVRLQKRGGKEGKGFKFHIIRGE